MYTGNGCSNPAQEEALSVGKVQIGRVRGLFPWRFAQSGAANRRAHGSQYARRLSPLHPIALDNVNLVGGTESIKMEHETSLIFGLLFFPNYLYFTVHLIFPVHCVCSFHATCFPVLPLPFISMCRSSETFSFLSRLLSFQSSWTITIPFCAWSKSSPPLSPSLSCPFLSAPPTWKAPFFWCSYDEGGGVSKT